MSGMAIRASQLLTSGAEMLIIQGSPPVFLVSSHGYQYGV